MKLALDLSHTAHTLARTGIQRVCRSLHDELGKKLPGLVAITRDPFEKTWRPLEAWERQNLSNPATSQSRKSSWPQSARWRGRLKKWLHAPPQALPSGCGLLMPEPFDAGAQAALPSLFAHMTGPRVAIFHDAIPLKLPSLSPLRTIARFPAYLHGLLRFDGVAADSEESRQNLVDYWHWAGWTNPPPVIAMPLGIDMQKDVANRSTQTGHRPRILSVGSLEGRKNHIALLTACETLWRAGLDFELHLIGLAHAQTGRMAVAQLNRLQAEGCSLFYHGPVNDAGLEQAYAACTFTVYPSLMEGFGLPVLESLARGKPCICLGQGALGESARGGGCLALAEVTAPALAAAMRELLTAPATLHRLQTEASARRFRTWSDYADDLLGWMSTLPRRSP